MVQLPNPHHWVIGIDGVTHMGYDVLCPHWFCPHPSCRNSQLEGGDWTEYNYGHWTVNHMFVAGTCPHVSPLEVPSRCHWATVTQGTLVVPSPSSNVQGYPSQFVDRPPNVDASQVTDSSPGEGTFECRWLQKGEKGPCGQVFSHRKEVVKHLNYAHGVGGSSRHDITCRWLPHYASSVCGCRIQRRAVSRHVDIHLHYTVPCPHPSCKKSYSRQESLKKHMKSHDNRNSDAWNVDCFRHRELDI